VSRHLDFGDIQGGILREYGGDFPRGRYVFLKLPDSDPLVERNREQSRAFLDEVRRWVTTAVRWDSKAIHYPGLVQATKPPVTFNIGFTFNGLLTLGLPVRVLQRLPDEFIEGMAARAHVLGDVARNSPENWDPIWREHGPKVHVVVIMRAQIRKDTSGEPVPELEEMTQRLMGFCQKYGVTVLSGHKGPTDLHQDASLLLAMQAGHMAPRPQEHFGFTDGISEVAFEEQGADLRVEGGGKILPDGTWNTLATGEFLLGHPDESQEFPPTAPPSALMRNGTFLAYRKLHQNVKSFQDYIAQAADEYGAITGEPAAEAAELIKAKMVGRWPNGVPLMQAPTYKAMVQFGLDYQRDLAAAGNDEEAKAAVWRRLVNFRYKDDPEGIKCPLGAHMRRVNTRDMLDTVDHSSVLNNRRRILRRGLPYGADASDDEGEHGVVFLAYCASLFRQFEFVQQQWLQYGLDFNAGNDRCPILGTRVEGESHKHVIPSDPASGAPPFICSNMPQFVEMRGGDYFFVPSLTALRMMAMGTVDPT
jgi:Dyp-type peroxidase family